MSRCEGVTGSNGTESCSGTWEEEGEISRLGWKALFKYFLLSFLLCSHHCKTLIVFFCSIRKQALSNTLKQALSFQALLCLLLTAITMATTATQPIPSTEPPLLMTLSTELLLHTTPSIELLRHMIQAIELHRNTISKIRLHISESQPPILTIIQIPSSMTMLSQLGKSYAALSVGDLADLFQSSLTLL